MVNREWKKPCHEFIPICVQEWAGINPAPTALSRGSSVGEGFTPSRSTRSERKLVLDQTTDGFILTSARGIENLCGAVVVGSHRHPQISLPFPVKIQGV
jgi:hypothetical protein